MSTKPEPLRAFTQSPMNACNWECEFCEGLDGRPFPVGFRSSKLSKAQMSKLIDWLIVFGAENGVKFTHEQGLAA